MGMTDDYYDFHCGNDPRLVKIAIKSDNFHTITIRANIAKTIDFSGGTRNVEIIRLNKCFKATRIIWPERTGAIRRLYIHHADTLTHLDISALTSLEELSILNCRKLETITGMPDTLKEINIHHVKLNELDCKQLSRLQKINFFTSLPHTQVDASSLAELQVAAITTSRIATPNLSASSINLKDCPALHTIFIDTGDNSVDADISGCKGLQETIILCSENSSLSGLEDCKELEIFHSSQPLKMNVISRQIADKFKPGTPKDKISEMTNMTQVFYDLTRNTTPGIHDRETNIQEKGSQIEVDKGNGAKIILLSSIIDTKTMTSEKDLSKELRSALIDPKYLPSGILLPIYYLPELPQAADLLGISPTKVVSFKNPSKSISAWLENNDASIPNVLLIPQPALNNPEVLNFLKQFRKDPKNILFRKKQYRLRPFDKVILRGDWYRVSNKVPFIAKSIIPIPLAALFPAPGIAMMSLTEALPAYQQALMDTSSELIQRMLESNNTLSQRNRNLQTLRQAMEIKILGNQFFYYLEQALQQPPEQAIIDARAQLPPDQTLIDGGAEPPPDMQPKKALQVPLREPIDQTRIDGGAEPPPDMQPKKALQTPLREPIDQTRIDASAEPPLDMQPKKALQTPLREPIDQTRIDASAEPPPDMQPKKALQTPLREPIDQTRIDASAESPPDMQPKIALQTPISITAGSNDLQSTPSLHTETNEQRLLKGAKNLADAVKVMLDNTEGIPEQVLINVEKAQLTASETQENLLEASRNLATAIQKMAANACAIDTNKSSPSAHAAAVLINSVNMELKKDTHKTALIDTARELIVSIELLAKSCASELPKTKKAEMKDELSPKLRSSIIKILHNTHEQYARDHNMLNVSENLFGRKPGKEGMRLEILRKFINCMTNTEKLGNDEVERDFAKLMKDRDLKYALGGIEEEIKRSLTGIRPPEPKPAPKSKLEDSD